MYVCKYLNEKVNKLDDIKYIILMGILARSIPFLFLPLMNLYEKYIGKIGRCSVLDIDNKILLLLLEGIIGPIFESYIIILIIKILQRRFKNKLNVLLITSIIFSFMHYYSILYMIIIFIPGLIFIYSYMYYKPKHFSSFFIMTSVHAIFNLIALLAS